jgi:hypothetical protein
MYLKFFIYLFIVPGFQLKALILLIEPYPLPFFIKYVRLTQMGKPNKSQMTKQAGFIEIALLGEGHRPLRTGPEKSHPRNGSLVFIIWVKSRA